jgi:hypothetical protein
MRSTVILLAAVLAIIPATAQSATSADKGSLARAAAVLMTYNTRCEALPPQAYLALLKITTKLRQADVQRAQRIVDAHMRGIGRNRWCFQVDLAIERYKDRLRSEGLEWADTP